MAPRAAPPAAQRLADCFAAAGPPALAPDPPAAGPAAGQSAAPSRGSSPAPPTASGGEWQCAACTVFNAASLARCGVCDTPRAGVPPGGGTPAPAPTPTPTPPPAGYWACSVCTVNNPMSAAACGTCGQGV